MFWHIAILSCAFADTSIIWNNLNSLRVNNSLSGATEDCIRHLRFDHGDCVFRWIVESNSNDLVIEVGAHTGEQAIQAIQLGHDVVSYEADPQHFDSIENRLKSISRKAENSWGHLKLLNRALSDKADGEMTFLSHGSDSHLLSPGDNLSCGQCDALNVSLSTLDIEMERGMFLNTKIPLVLKIDTQGSDLNVVAGGLKTIETKSFPYVMVEYWPTATKVRRNKNPSILLYMLGALGINYTI